MKTKMFYNFQFMIPINIITLFQLLTIVLFFFGPIKYDIHNPGILFFYLIAVVLALRFGFLSIALKTKTYSNVSCSRIYTKKERTTLFKRSSQIKFDLILLVYFLSSLFILYSRTGSFLFDFSAFNNLGRAYYSRGGEWNVTFERIVLILSPLTTLFIPYGMINFKKVNFFRKGLFIIAIAFRVLVDLVQGINKSFADIIIFVCILIVFLLCRSSILNPKKTRKTSLRFFGFAVTVIFLLFFFISFFSVNILSRTANDPNGYSNGFLYLISYLTEGYQAVDYSLTQPFTSTFGLGNSMYLLEALNVESLFERTYLFKNELIYGWSWYTNWSTVYVWIANDVSMIGVIPIMFLIGRLFATTWKQSIYEGNISSLIVASLMFQLCIYSPANNQIVQLQAGLISTWFWLLFWLITRQFGIGQKRTIIYESSVYR